eukprot:958132_1
MQCAQTQFDHIHCMVHVIRPKSIIILIDRSVIHPYAYCHKEQCFCAHTIRASLSITISAKLSSISVNVSCLIDYQLFLCCHHRHTTHLLKICALNHGEMHPSDCFLSSFDPNTCFHQKTIDKD